MSNNLLTLKSIHVNPPNSIHYERNRKYMDYIQNLVTRITKYFDNGIMNDTLSITWGDIQATITDLQTDSPEFKDKLWMDLFELYSQNKWEVSLIPNLQVENPRKYLGITITLPKNKE